jgi:hypothetical protein
MTAKTALREAGQAGAMLLEPELKADKRVWDSALHSH